VSGRKKTLAARREQLVDEFERSGLSGCKSAELAGLKYQTFATWVQKRRRQNGTYAKLPVNAADAVTRRAGWKRSCSLTTAVLFVISSCQPVSRCDARLTGKNTINHERCSWALRTAFAVGLCRCFQTVFGPFPVGRGELTPV